MQLSNLPKDYPTNKSKINLKWVINELILDNLFLQISSYLWLKLTNHISIILRQAESPKLPTSFPETEPSAQPTYRSRPSLLTTLKSRMRKIPTKRATSLSMKRKTFLMQWLIKEELNTLQESDFTTKSTIPSDLMQIKTWSTLKKYKFLDLGTRRSVHCRH